MKNIFAFLSIMSLTSFAVDIPSQGGTLAIPAGEAFSVNDSNLTDFLKVGLVDIPETSSLVFEDLSQAMVTLSMPFTGKGNVVIKDRPVGEGFIMKADNSNFEGSFYITNSHIRVQTLTGIGVGRPVDYYSLKNKSNSRLQLEAVGNYNVPIKAKSEAHWGVGYVNVGTTNMATIQVVHSTSFQGPGCHAGHVIIENGSFYTVSEIKFAPGSTVEGLSNNCCLVADGGTLIEIGCKHSNMASYRAYRDTTRFLDENVFNDDLAIYIGVGYARSGKLDLNGFNQRCKALYLTLNEEGAPKTWITSPDDKPASLTILNQVWNFNFQGQLNGSASLVYDSGAQNWLNLMGKENQTKGSITVKGGVLKIDPIAVFTRLSKIEVSGGRLEVKSNKINPDKVVLELKDTGKINIASDVTFRVRQAIVNGVYLAPGEYTKSSPETSSFITGDGVLNVLYDNLIEEGETYVWVGGTDANLENPANWEGGVAPDFNSGSSVLSFPNGCANVKVNGEVRVYGIKVSGENALNISGGENSKIVLGEGGINIERSDDAITSLEHIIDVPLDISYVPQSWILDATNTTLSIKKSISSLNSVLPILIDSKEKGGIGFYEDNSNLTVPLMFTNLTVYMPPRVYHPNGLGSPSREVTFSGSHPNFMNATWGKPFTNYVPLRISSNNTTAKPGRYLQESGRTDCMLYLAGPVTFYSVVTSQKNLYSRGHLHFLGGIIDDNSRELCFRMEGGDNWIEDKPINFSSPLTIDYDSVLNIAATNNVWSTLHYYAAKIKCQNENVLAVDGEMKAGHGHNVYFRVPGGSLDLNGYNQKVKRFYIGWNPASTSTNSKGVPYYTGYTVVTSAVPASLQITGSSSDVIAVDVQGVAGLKYYGTGVLTLTNHTQSTLGELKVSQGRINLRSGSGWIATTNVVVEGGILSVGKEVGARAFGQEQDASRANLWVSGDGVLDIAEGERATVLTLTKINEDGTLKYCTPGVYGGADCAVDGVVKSSHISGKGVLYVRSTLKPSTLLIIK